jgi:hypothetical protein
MRRPAVAIFAVLLIGLGLTLARALSGSELDAVRPGVLAQSGIAELSPGHVACERPLDLDRRASRMGVALYADDRPGPQLELEVRALDGGNVLAEATIPAGWTIPLGSQYVVDLSPTVPAGSSVAVCVRNSGNRAATLVGRQAIAKSALYPETGEPIQSDWAIYFPLTEDERRSYAGMSGDILKRASVLRPGVVTPLTYVLLGLALLVGGPLLLSHAVTRAAAEPD